MNIISFSFCEAQENGEDYDKEKFNPLNKDEQELCSFVLNNIPFKRLHEKGIDHSMEGKDIAKAYCLLFSSISTAEDVATQKVDENTSKIDANQYNNNNKKIHNNVELGYFFATYNCIGQTKKDDQEDANTFNLFDYNDAFIASKG